jgi:hypothetical protein
MKRTLTALYRTRAEAQNVSDALKNANLGADVQIVDQTAADAHPEHRDFVAWLGGLFDGHEDKHAYEEGLRRGHFLLTAKLDELKETRAAEILYAAGPLDLQDAQRAWRAEGWEGPYAGAYEPASPGADAQPSIIIGHSVRSYSLEATPAAWPFPTPEPRP